jgi:hypothetical protein
MPYRLRTLSEKRLDDFTAAVAVACVGTASPEANVVDISQTSLSVKIRHMPKNDRLPRSFRFRCAV